MPPTHISDGRPSNCSASGDEAKPLTWFIEYGYSNDANGIPAAVVECQLDDRKSRFRGRSINEPSSLAAGVGFAPISVCSP